jgi:XTP/dITP diphosphohydrolase
METATERSAGKTEILRRYFGHTDFRPGQEPLVAEGGCPGVILRARRGKGGFGYDPLFLYEPLGKTFAEVNEEEKNAISHRARACERMKQILREDAEE